jgi:hypothetical protein
MDSKIVVVVVAEVARGTRCRVFRPVVGEERQENAGRQSAK